MRTTISSATDQKCCKRRSEVRAILTRRYRTRRLALAVVVPFGLLVGMLVGAGGRANSEPPPSWNPTTTGTLPGELISSVSGESWQAAPLDTVREVTDIPTAVFDEVGVQPTVIPPVALSSQPTLRFDGKPGVYYLGSEPCPLCAAERWAFIAATSRFGTWVNLGIGQSGSKDEFPNTQTFTFLRASFSSRFITVRTVENLGSQQIADDAYAVLQRPTSKEAAIYSRYDSAEYFPGHPGPLPFLDFGNRVVMAGPNYDPASLAGLSRTQIASDLSDSTSPVSKNIVGTANYLTAAICRIDGGRPSSVCSSSAVAQAARHFAKAGAGIGGCAANPPKASPACG